MLSQTLPVLGVAIGAWIAHSVTDETGWYNKQFLIATVVTLLAIPIALIFSPGPYNLLASMIATVICIIAFMLSLRAHSLPVLAVATAALILIGGVGVWQIVLVTLIPATGYLYVHIVKRDLWWFLLTPTIIILWQLLV